MEEEKKTSDDDRRIVSPKLKSMETSALKSSDGSKDEIIISNGGGGSGGDTNSNSGSGGDSNSNRSSSSSKQREGYTADCSSDCSDFSSSSSAEAQDATPKRDTTSIHLWNISDSQKEDKHNKLNDIKKPPMEGTETKLKAGQVRDLHRGKSNGHLSMTTLNSNQRRKEQQFHRKSCSPIAIGSREQNSIIDHKMSTLIVNPVVEGGTTIDLSSVKLVPASAVSTFKDSRCSTIKAMEGSGESSSSSSSTNQVSKSKKKQDMTVQTSGNFYSRLLESCKPFYSYTDSLDRGDVNHSDEHIHNTSGDTSNNNNIEASSMAVLVRTKRKHRKVHQIGSQLQLPEHRNDYVTTSQGSSSSNNKQQESNNIAEKSTFEIQDTRGSSSSSNNAENDSNLTSRRNDRFNNADVNHLDNEEHLSSSNSLNNGSVSSSSRRANALLYQLDVRAQQPSNRKQGDLYHADQNRNDQGQRSMNDCRSRVVSDTMASSNNGSTGTGSGNDTSGAGNKKSSTENSGDGNSDEYRTKENTVTCHENQHSVDPRDLKISIQQQTEEEGSATGDAATTATQERLAEKKRKRLDRRREYEEGVQKKLRDPSDSVLDNDKMMVPGESLTIEEAISLTNVARFVVAIEYF